MTDGIKKAVIALIIWTIEEQNARERKFEMIQVNISEVKNRLSYYLRLVRGGEQIEILDRKTPLARITHVSKAETVNRETPWIKEMVGLGIVSPPKKEGFPAELLDREKVTLPRANGKTSALKALLEERNTGR